MPVAKILKLIFRSAGNYEGNLNEMYKSVRKGHYKERRESVNNQERERERQRVCERELKSYRRQKWDRDKL